MIRLDGFTFKYYGQKSPLLDDVNLTIRDGEIVYIYGRSGSGKTTLAEALAGFLFHPDQGIYSGKIEMNGKSPEQVSLQKWARDVYLVQQNPFNQFCTLTVEDEIAFGLENLLFDREEIEKRIFYSLQCVDGGHLVGRNIFELSGGEQQKIAIATAIALKPKVLILDEPSSNLDPESINHLFESLAKLRTEIGLSLIIIDHQSIDSNLKELNTYELINGNLSRIQFSRREKQVFQGIGIKHVSSGEILLNLVDVEISRDGQTILTVPELKICEGEVISISGPNGSGKTSLLLSLMGFITCSGKKKELLGNEISAKIPFEVRKRIGYAMQNPDDQIFCDSVNAEISFSLKNYYKNIDEFTEWKDQLIEVFNFQEYLNIHPYKLSYGQKGRLNLAAILSYKPKLLLLDEIFIGQDWNNIQMVLGFLNSYIKKEKAAAIIVNHQQELIRNFASSYFYIENGQLIEN